MRFFLLILFVPGLLFAHSHQHYRPSMAWDSYPHFMQPHHHDRYCLHRHYRPHPQHYILREPANHVHTRQMQVTHEHFRDSAHDHQHYRG